MGFTWETIEYSDKTVYLQLTFENAMYISVGSAFDLLTIEVLNNGKFRSRENYLTIEANTTLAAGVPRQIIETAEIKALAKNSESAGGGVSGALGANFLINILFGGSLNLLWGMIHNLEVVSPYFLLSLNLPANAAMMYTMMYDIANFDMIPTDLVSEPLYEWIGMTKTEDSDEGQSQSAS